MVYGVVQQVYGVVTPDSVKELGLSLGFPDMSLTEEKIGQARLETRPEFGLSCQRPVFGVQSI